MFVLPNENTNSIRVLFTWTAPMVSFCCSNQVTLVIQETVFSKILLCPSATTRKGQVWVLIRYLPFLGQVCFLSFKFFLLFLQAQSSSVAYGNGVCVCISFSFSSSSWMELAGSSCSDCAPVSNSCSSRKELPMPYCSSCAFVSAGETWGDPKTKAANLPNF